MSRRKRNKSDKIKTVLPHDEIKTVLKPKVTNFNIEFVPIVFDAEDGKTLNGIVFEKLLSVLEDYSIHFGDDFMPKLGNYSEWLKSHIDFAFDVWPWIFGVIVNGKPQGMVWAHNWETTGYACEIGGFAKRGTPVEATRQTINKLVGIIFQTTPAHVLRGESAFSNRAARLAMVRAGFSNPENKRAWRLVEGQEVTGIIYSITRPEWEALRHGE